MAKFVWQPQGQQPMAFAIRQERVAVGRDAGNDIRLPEPAVSARHAVVITRMSQSTVHDLNSSNGTWVNGKKVESQQLRHGDTVQFGRLAMTFVDEATATQQPGKSPTTLRDPPAPTITLGGRAGAAMQATGAFRVPVAPPAVRPAEPDAPELAELDRLMGSIRTHRASEQKNDHQRHDELVADWRKTMELCAALKGKLGGEPRVRFFDVSERRNEVVIRVEKKPGQPTQLLMLTLGHPDTRDKAPDGIWMRQSSHADRRYDKSAEVMRDLVTSIAHLLA